MERAAWLERRYGARVVWVPFDLHPEYPLEGIPRRELEARYEEGFHARVQLLIEQAGFTYNPPDVIPNSKGSLQLAELARDEGRFHEVHTGLFRAYWSEHRNIGELQVLSEIAAGAGLNPSQVQQVLAEGRHEDRIDLTTRFAHELGTGGVPTWLIDDKLLVSGAQPHEVFERSMSELGHEPVEE